jgi:hypothetical protein
VDFFSEEEIQTLPSRRKGSQDKMLAPQHQLNVEECRSDVALCMLQVEPSKINKA